MRLSPTQFNPSPQILIANNGMAAAKCIMSMRRWAFLTLGDEQALQFVAMVRASRCAKRARSGDIEIKFGYLRPRARRVVPLLQQLRLPI